MKTKKITIYLCPDCKEYLGKHKEYKTCMYCGWKYKISKLIKKNIKVNDDFVDGSIYREKRVM